MAAPGWIRRLLGAVLSGAALHASAAVLEVAPVMHDLPPGKAALSMTVTNRADSAVTLQVRGFGWTQHDGEDRLAPAGEVIVAPAIFKLAPGQTQVVRALVQASLADRERSYRLLIDELPVAEGGTLVRMALRLSVPVFVHAAARTPAQIAWHIEPGMQALVATNVGGSRERIRELALLGPGGQRIAAMNATGPYLLSGAQRRWTLGDAGRALQPGDAVTLSALTDAGRIEVPLVVAP